MERQWAISAAGEGKSGNESNATTRMRSRLRRGNTAPNQDSVFDAHYLRAYPSVGFEALFELQLQVVVGQRFGVRNARFFSFGLTNGRGVAGSFGAACVGGA